MSKTWNHARLGSFTYDVDRDGWVGSCELPELNVFTLKPRSKKAAVTKELLIESSNAKVPSSVLVALAEKVIANHGRLATQIAPVLLADFKGQGPKSGMWWHGDLGQLNWAFQEAKQPIPTCPKDFFPLMRMSRLLIHQAVYKYDKPVAEFTFAAVFEEEHGVGVLTDGDKIVGTGYAGDASPFEK